MAHHARVRVISAAEVRRLLPMADCIELMADALGALARGEAINPLRSVTGWPDANGALGVMPAAIAKPAIAGAKLISVVPGNRALGLESHRGVVVLFKADHGEPVAAVDAGAITAIRTAAVSGLATRLLACPEAGDLAILGSGTQARTHLEAVRQVRTLRRVRVWSPSAERREAFVSLVERELGVTMEPVESPAAAVSGAEIVCTVTAAREPILHGDWLAAGSHVNAVGSSQPVAREIDAEALRRARIFVDRRESALAESGDLIGAIADGAVRPDDIVAELGEVVVGSVAGRGSDDEITLFESLGLGVEDVAAAAHVYRAALDDGSASEVSLG